MNCRPNELAVVAIPEGFRHHELAAQLNGMVVRTGTVSHDGLWSISPKIDVVLAQGYWVPPNHVWLPGHHKVDRIHDVYLRPIRPRPVEDEVTDSKPVETSA